MQKLQFSDHSVIIISDKSDGNMRIFPDLDEQTIINNQTKLAQAVGLTPFQVARLHIDYNNRDNFTVYREISQDNIGPYSINNPESQIPLADGLVTKDPNISLLLPLADCLGIIVLDEAQRILGLVHSGRHNVEQSGPQKFIEFFVKNYNSQAISLKVYFSPCAQNYEIFALDHQKLPIIARSQLIAAGIKASNITESKINTVTNPNYPSNSAGDHTSRFAIATRM